MKILKTVPLEIISEKLTAMNSTSRLILFDQFKRRTWEYDNIGGWSSGWMPFLRHLQETGQLKEFYFRVNKSLGV